MKKTRKYYPPKNVVHVTVYLTPEQHEGAKMLAQRETDRLAQAWKQDPSTALPQRVSVSDIIRGLVARELVQRPTQPALTIERTPVNISEGTIHIAPPTPETREEMEAFGVVDGQVVGIPAPTPATELAGAKRTRKPRKPKAPKA